MHRPKQEDMHTLSHVRHIQTHPFTSITFYHSKGADVFVWKRVGKALFWCCLFLFSPPPPHTFFSLFTQIDYWKSMRSSIPANLILFRLSSRMNANSQINKQRLHAWKRDTCYRSNGALFSVGNPCFALAFTISCHHCLELLSFFDDCLCRLCLCFSRAVVALLMNQLTFF